MDIASRFHPGRARPAGYLDRNGNGLPDDSGTESESYIRRKFQRTNADGDTSNESTFRKPSIPASASRSQPEQRPGFSHNRRRSAALRENARVPSGPREFPIPHKRIPSGGLRSLAPSGYMSESTNSPRTYLPSTTSEPYFSKTGEAPQIGNGSHATSLSQASNDLDLIPTVSFDDLQNSIANYDGNGPLLSETRGADHERKASRDTSGSMLRDPRSSDSGPPVPKLEPRAEQGVSRNQSLRRRLSAVTGAGKQNLALSGAKDGNIPQASNLSLRTRRQSAAPTGPPPAEPAPPPLGAGARAPRKSLGPGVLTSMLEGRKASQPSPSTAADSSLKSSLARTNSLSRTQRRSTMQATSGGAELSRASTLTATTQSRANKVKSLQPPPREPQEPNTPSAKSGSKASQNRAQTPSSSGNKRQSTVSGRASGLGARTISPTDARRLKRLSMMQAPPLPSNPSTSSIPKLPAAAHEEQQPSRSELPRLAQPSPSLIPRRSSNATPSSTRTSPENRNSQYGGVALSTKSSYSSLVNSASTSRLPTPKPRNVHSSSAQYGEGEEMVPPVPAIPKAFESPRDTECAPFFSNLDMSADGGNDAVFPHKLPKPVADRSFEVKPRSSIDRPRPHHRMNTIDNIERSMNLNAAKPQRPQNGNLQPLRLPPLNLMPIGTQTSRTVSYPLPSQETDTRDDFSFIQTPEPKRTAKTPSTPMTASKATFLRRQDEELAKQKAMRSASSHYALRDLMQLDDQYTKFFDDSDIDFMGVPIPSGGQRNAITPFSSGSLPKASGEFVRQRGRPSADFGGDFNTISNFETFQQQSVKPQGPRPSRSGTNNTLASFKTAESSSADSPVESSGQAEGKKESSSGAIRRKLSLGWRRSSSKSNLQPDNKPSPKEESAAITELEKSTLPKRTSQMLPPKLPASATWTGDVPSIPTAGGRPSLDSTRRKSTAASTATSSSVNVTDSDTMPTTKTKSMHSEQPQPVSTASRATSWGNMNPMRPATKATPNLNKTRQASTASAISAIIKDKDDIAADDEMKRLSQKRRDIDTAAKETEELKKRAVAKSPTSPERVLHDRTAALNIFERGEIMDYEKEGVYFTGNKNARKIIGSLTPSPQPGDKESKAGNYGYDDERGDYNIVLGDHLAYRYEVVDVLGKGSFGQVVRCVDHKEGGVVAVKIIRNKKRFHQQALVEVGILGRLREWDPDSTHATLSITSSFYFRSHLCIVTPCLGINLYELIRAHNFVGFSLPLIRRFARQLLSCLVLLQKKAIIHCDLKPENILLCEARKADVRVIDFGSSCKETEKVYTYIQSRFYRSPEVILGSSYGLGIDMWSLGCILAELWTGYPLFPGENEQEQLACIMEIFGPPDRHLVERCTRKKLFFDSVGKPRVTVSSKGRRRRPSSKTLSQALKSEDEAFLDFIARCLRWDPDRRLKPSDAVNHPFITNQPFHQYQRNGAIPEEARRAARLRSTAAAPATNGGIPSPVKRTNTTASAISGSGNAFAQQQAQAQQTPAKDRSRPLPETPQTAVRNGVPISQSAATGSPSKRFPVNRRESVNTSGSTAPVAGSKRTKDGQPLIPATGGAPVTQRQASVNSTGSLAQMAASAATGNAARWRP